MSICTFESLPNEVWLLILGYLSSFERYKAFFRINNIRLEQVLHCQSFTLNATSISYSQMNEIFLETNYLRLLHTIILNHSCSSLALKDFWEKKISPVPLTPNLQRLIVERPEFCAYSLTHPILSSLSTTTRLQSIHLRFRYANSTYASFIKSLIERQISFHTMIFEIKQEWHYDRHQLPSYFSELNNLHWSRTVELKLTVQYPLEMLFILRKNALPLLEHLDIIVEQEQLPFNPSVDATQFPISFSENDIRQTVDLSALRTVVLRHLSLDHLVMFIRSVEMPLVKKMTLVDIFDQTLGHWEEFRQAVQQQDFPCLREFYFLICFPAHLYEQFQATVVQTFADLPWPLTNLAYHYEEQILPHYSIFRATKGVLLLYTSPLEILFQYTRVIFNHTFAQNSTAINRRSVKWMCNRVDDIPQLNTTLNKLASGHVKLLDLHFYGTEAFLPNNGSISVPSHFCYPSLRSVIFAFDSVVILRSERVYIIEQILRRAPLLSYLTVDWDDLWLCTQSNRNVQCLRLRLDKLRDDPNLYVDVDFLVRLLPSISCLETTGRRIVLNDHLVRFILKIVGTFDQLVQLMINRPGYIPIQPEMARTIEKAILRTGHEAFA